MCPFLLISGMISFMNENMHVPQLLDGNEDAKAEMIKLTEDFLEAFVDDFRNGTGRSAVHFLFYTLSEIIRNLEGGSIMPMIKTMHVTSTVVSHSFSISEESSLVSF